MRNFYKMSAWADAVPAERCSASAPAPSEACASAPRDARLGSYTVTFIFDVAR